MFGLLMDMICMVMPPVQMMHDGERVQGNQFSNCFKRELIDTSDGSIYPTGFGIPEERIREVDFSIKNQLFPKTAPSMRYLW